MGTLGFQVLKYYLLEDKPSIVIDNSRDLVFGLIPDFKKSYGFDQHNDWHIYDVYNHILKVVDNVPAILPLRIAALFHDMGKPYKYTEDEAGVGHFYNHWLVSMEIFENYQDEFGLNDEEIELIKNLIYYHDLRLPTDENSIERMKEIFGDNLYLLFELKKADILGQNPKYHDRELEKLNELKDIYLSKKYIKKPLDD